MKILLLGKNGQVGWELHRALVPLGEVLAYDYPEINFEEPDSLLRLITSLHPDVIVNAVAYTAVDQAEGEKQKAKQINATVPGVLAEAAKQSKAGFIHYSTDYVYDGTKGSPYVETDRPNPLNFYAVTKLEGDQAVEAAGGAFLVLRSSWIYSNRRDSFVSKVLNWSRSERVMRVVDDQIGCPTWARGIAELTSQILASGRENIYDWLNDRRGVYHLANGGMASRFEWAQEILKLDPSPQEQAVEELLPAKTADFPTPAVRPLFSALSCQKLGEVFGLNLPDWKESLRLMMAQL